MFLWENSEQAGLTKKYPFTNKGINLSLPKLFRKLLVPAETHINLKSISMIYKFT